MSGLRLPDLPAGVWRHYKGPLYQVLGYAHDADDDERVVVVYFGLELDDAHEGPRMAVRDAESFLGMVMVGDNEVVQRFTYVAPQFLRGQRKFLKQVTDAVLKRPVTEVPAEEETDVIGSDES